MRAYFNALGDNHTNKEGAQDGCWTPSVSAFFTVAKRVGITSAITRNMPKVPCHPPLL